MNTPDAKKSGEFAEWVVWVVMGGGFVIAPLTLWIATRLGLPPLTITRIEYTLFTIGMLGFALCHSWCNKYAKKLEKYRLSYEFFVPGAFGPTKIKNTYRYITEQFSEVDKINFRMMQLLGHSAIFSICIAFGCGAYLLFVDFGK